MKKVFYCALTFLAFLACSKQAEITALEEMTPDPGKYIFTISASVDDSFTKTDYTNKGQFSWSAHDKISVLFHDGETHRFYDLETVAGAAHGESAVFVGQIDEGFVLGASDGKYWALYPAGAHTYDASAGRPVFNIPQVTDFTTATHVSANLPMAYSNGSNPNAFTFNNASCPYKISFKNVDVAKVRFTVTHSASRKLSGNFTMEKSTSNVGLWSQASSDVSDRSVSFIKNVSGDKTVDFYFSIPRWGEDAGFQPTITLKDEDTGYTIYTSTAKSDWSEVEKLQPKYNRMVILPSIPASGLGSPFVSSYDIDWLTAPGVSGSTASGNDAVKCLKYSATGSKLYLYFELDESKLYNDPAYQYGNHWYMFFGDGSGDVASQWTETCDGKFEGWVKKDNSYKFDYWGSTGTTFSGIERNYTTVGGTVFVELSIDRSNAAYLQGTSCQFGLCLTSKYVDGGGSWLGSDSTIIGIAPVGGGAMMSMTLPTYVAP